MPRPRRQSTKIPPKKIRTGEKATKIWTRKAPAHSNLLHIDEPLLEFRFGQTLQYPRDGLYLFGPVDGADHPRQIKYGVIGTAASVERFERWAESVSHFLDVPGARPGS